MHKKHLRQHKLSVKVLEDPPLFAPVRRGKLPKPLHQIGGPRVQATPLIDVSLDHQVWFMWRDGQTLEQSAFYAYLFRKVGQNDLYPLCHFHWHPSHKPAHIKTPCNADINYVNRALPGATELMLKQFRRLLDPRIEQDRLRLIEVFCKASGINFGKQGLPL